MSEKPKVGSVSWRDLTIPNAKEVAEFYRKVVGWKIEPAAMGDYEDYSMLDGNGECVAGVCHARGGNAGMPPQWLIYITVEDVEASARKCVEQGGTILDGPRAMGDATLYQ